MLGAEISQSCISLTFSHLQLLGPTNMAADDFNFCDLHETGCLIQSRCRDQFWLSILESARRFKLCNRILLSYHAIVPWIKVTETMTWLMGYYNDLRLSCNPGSSEGLFTLWKPYLVPLTALDEYISRQSIAALEEQLARNDGQGNLHSLLTGDLCTLSCTSSRL